MYVSVSARTARALDDAIQLLAHEGWMPHVWDIDANHLSVAEAITLAAPGDDGAWIRSWHILSSLTAERNVAMWEIRRGRTANDVIALLRHARDLARSDR